MTGKTIKKIYETNELAKGFKWVPGKKNLWGFPMQVEDHVFVDVTDITHAWMDMPDVDTTQLFVLNVDTGKHVSATEVNTVEGWATVYEKGVDGALGLIRIEANFKLQKDVQDYG